MEGDCPNIADGNVAEIRCLSKTFGEVRAVDCVSFDVKSGEILGLLGPNGAGKTTTLHMMLGLITPTSGTINVLGCDMQKNREAILERVNFSSSYVSLPFSLTVRENLRIFANIYAVKNKERKIDELIETFEIGNIEKTPIRSLSSGQITRVCLAKALLNDPEILFLDEPTASLDPDMADKTRTLLKRVRDERGMSILVTSHNMTEMEEITDRIIFIDKGSLLAEGPLADILTKFGGSSLEEVFLSIARNGATGGK